MLPVSIEQVRVVPFPSSLSSLNVPPAFSAFSFIMGIPSPTFRVVRVVAKGLVTRASSSGLMPLPLSMSSMVSIRSSPRVRRTVTRLAPAVMLFCARSSR